MPMEQLNFSNAQGAPSFLAVLLSSKLLQYRTNRHYLLLRDRGRSSKARRTPRARRRNLSPPPHLLKVPVLPHQVQQPRSHHPSHCGLVSFCLSVAHLPRTPMVINRSSTCTTILLFTSSALPTILFPRRETRLIILTAMTNVILVPKLRVSKTIS
ncbi:uncharacterized protein HD556DRAFT_954318 [Suillus plorans]|uniref:Uncharacterized protein n=1 Tax=Suillus plorans TaxID=116603 RepID=A0A9P7DBM2_9AGAM|nr:uncharacterized protein HD556DRAFT_954318 [Suillus plorans]KAG1787438.1 hypothetical protein HD556DRAFT_954318 [Suillus plorans]